MHLGPYELIAQVGAGASAVVWRAREPTTGLPLAIKVLTGEEEPDPDRLAAFRIEARAAGRLSHPNIVRLLDQGVVKAGHELGPLVRAGAPYLVMEFMPGGSLTGLRGRLGGQTLFEVLHGALAALAHAHAHGLIHRDVKPANFMFAGDGRVCLGDFGLAWRSSNMLGNSGLAGTPNYMPPEQIRVEVLGPPADLYALGATTWRLVTGHAPFGGRSVDEALDAHLHEELPPFRPVVPVPPHLEAWLRIMLAKDPLQRFQRAADAAASLEEVRMGRCPRLGATPVFQGAAWREEPAQPLPAGVGLGVLRIRQLPQVGRDAERREVWSELGAVHAERRPRMVALEGSEGLGAERLADWLMRRAEERGLGLALQVRHAPERARSHGFSGMLARHFGLLPLPREERRAQLTRALRGIALQSEVSTVARLLGPAWLGEDTTLASPEERGVTIARVLTALCRERPVILMLESLQWGGGTLAELQQVLRLAPKLPMLLVGTYDAQLLGRSPVARELLSQLLAALPGGRLEIHPLTSQEQGAFLRQLVGLEPELVDHLSLRVEGHPDFALEIVGDWAARGLLEPGPKGLRLREGVLPELPDTVHLAFMRRLKPVLESSRGLSLMAAAVLGEEVSVREMRRICLSLGAPFDPQQDVEVYTRLELAFPEPASGAKVWRFAHPLLRESLLRVVRETGQWKRLHQACADMLARKSSLQNRERCAHHLEQAGRTEQAVAAYVALTHSYLQVGDRVPAERLIHRLELLRRGRPDAPVWVRHDLHRAWLGWSRGLANTGPIVRSAERRARALEDKTLLAEILLSDVSRRMEVIPDEVPGVLDECDRLVRSLGRVDLKLRLTARVARWLGRQGAHEAAVVQIQRRLSRLPETLDAQEQVWRLQLERTLGWSLVHLGRGAEAKELLEGQLELYRRQGNRLRCVHILNTLGEGARSEGDLSGARRLYLEALQIGESVGVEQLVAYPELNLGLVELSAGALEAADRHLERANLMLRRLNRPTALVVVSLALATLAMHRDDRAGLARHLDRAEQQAPRLSEADPDLGLLGQALVRGCHLRGWQTEQERTLRVVSAPMKDLGMLDELEALRALV